MVGILMAVHMSQAASHGKISATSTVLTSQPQFKFQNRRDASGRRVHAAASRAHKLYASIML